MSDPAQVMAHELEFHLRHARPGLFVDIGAHIGRFSTAMAACPGVEVVAIEPLPPALETLRAAAAQTNPPIHVIDRALSDWEGIATLCVPSLAGGPVWEWASMTKDFRTMGDAAADIVEIERYTVAVTTLDALGLTGVTAIKLDAEGAEYPVLRGARGILTRDWPLLTVELEERHAPGCTWAVPAFLDALGYDGFFELEGEMQPIAQFDRGRMQVAGLSPADRSYSEPYVNWFAFTKRGNEFR